MHLSFNYAVKSQPQDGGRVVTAEGFPVQILAEAFLVCVVCKHADYTHHLQSVWSGPSSTVQRHTL